MVAFEGDKIAHVLKVSTGRPGFDTPTGSFKVIAKNDTAMSSIYKSPMEFAMRLGNPYKGINIHQEKVPDVPASHGCIREHFKTAMMMFIWTPAGCPVEIAPGPCPDSIKYTETYDPTFIRDYYAAGDKDGGVRMIQEVLATKGYSVQVTGSYDAQTMAAVRAFQADAKLAQDGSAGIKTMQKMLAYLNYGF